MERLTLFGPALLQGMLHHGKAPAADSHSDTPNEPSVAALVSNMPRAKIIQFLVYEILGLLALFPQGIVPLAIKLFGGSERAWFLALYLPAPLQLPLIAFMICAGLLAVGYAAIIYFGHKAAVRKQEANGSIDIDTP
ncbi:hypothetical protein [Paenibacillus sp. GCM10023250]|uniref:hypothetical protein n=1 Tax=Paenibacillus sp. GCM10023250 TaxID=3252648 RepID=UPI00361BD758